MDRKPRAEHLFDHLVREGRLSRRALLRAALGWAGASLVSPLALGQAQPRTRFAGYPFTLGVASGYPSPTGVVLWTRLAPAPLQADGGMTGNPVDISWEVAEDERFARVVAQGKNRAVPELSHSVRAEVDGLRPGRRYFYRFHTGDEVSPVGRTRTFVSANGDPDRLRFAIGSCQHFEHGYYAAHRHLVQEDLDLMVFLGDYIYEGSWGEDFVRRHVGGEARSLDDYRIRHAQYRTDRDLQALHAAVPWILTWDDHEVDNDYAGAQSEDLDPQFLARRAAAYQAYLEHMPLPKRMWPVAGEMRIYDRLAFGRLATFHVIDDRQYRSPQPCPDPYKGGGSTNVYDCDLSALEADSLLGPAQQQWLEQGLAASRARWNFLAQQTLMARLDSDEGDRVNLWTDGWDAAPAARRRFLDTCVTHKVGNPVVLGGDLHATVVADLRLDADNSASPIVAAEFGGTSLSSQGWASEALAPRVRANPHVLFGDASKRGYLLFDVDRDSCRVKVRALDNEKDRESAIATQSAFVVEDGRPGVKRAV